MSSWKAHPDIGLYFCTSSIVDWYPIFTESRFFEVISESLSYCRHHKGLQIHAYVIMLNHLHLIISSNPGVTVSDHMRDFKRYTSGRLSTLLEEKNNRMALDLFKKAGKPYGPNRKYKVWQDGIHPIGIYSKPFFMQKLEYIHNNPVTKGYVVKPEHWFYSSARNYAGFTNTALEIDFLS